MNINFKKVLLDAVVKALESNETEVMEARARVKKAKVKKAKAKMIEGVIVRLDPVVIDLTILDDEEIGQLTTYIYNLSEVSEVFLDDELYQYRVHIRGSRRTTLDSLRKAASRVISATEAKYDRMLKDAGYRELC